MSKKSDTADALDQELADAILGARYFIVSIYQNGGWIKHPLSTIAQALAACPLLETSTASTRAAMIYAVSPEERSTMIPRDKAAKAVAFLARR